MSSPLSVPSDLSIAQLPASSLEGQSFDCIIIGAGPAGSTAAISLARRGYRVALIDRALFPRDKICGDCLLPESVLLLEHLGVAEAVVSHAHVVEGLRVFSASAIDFHISSRILSLRRPIFDTLLARAAVDAGAVFSYGTVDNVDDSPGTPVAVYVREADRPIFTKVILLACGVQTLLAQKAGLIETRSVSAIAARCYVRSAVGPVTGILSYDKSIQPGYAWIFPLGDGLFNVGCGTTAGTTDFGGDLLRKSFQQFIRQFGPAVDLFKHGEQLTPLRGYPIRCGLDCLSTSTPSRIIGIGEIIGTTYPFTGEGIAPAMRSALIASEIVADALAESDLSRLAIYADRLQKEMRSAYAGYRKAQQWLGHRWLNDLAARRIRNSPRLLGLCQQVVRGEIDPREIYSLKGILASFWS